MRKRGACHQPRADGVVPDAASWPPFAQLLCLLNNLTALQKCETCKSRTLTGGLELQLLPASTISACCEPLGPSGLRYAVTYTRDCEALLLVPVFLDDRGARDRLPGAWTPSTARKGSLPCSCCCGGDTYALRAAQRCSPRMAEYVAPTTTAAPTMQPTISPAHWPPLIVRASAVVTNGGGRGGSGPGGPGGSGGVGGMGGGGGRGGRGGNGGSGGGGGDGGGDGGIGQS